MKRTPGACLLYAGSVIREIGGLPGRGPGCRALRSFPDRARTERERGRNEDPERIHGSGREGQLSAGGATLHGVPALRGALEIQKLLRSDVLLLMEKLEAWEDYLDVIQGFKDLLELQRGIHEGIEKLTKKK